MRSQETHVDASAASDVQIRPGCPPTSLILGPPTLPLPPSLLSLLSLPLPPTPLLLPLAARASARSLAKSGLSFPASAFVPP
mmetsp:Transcript_40571/g.92014  ORF Transcript_40571/g.92014 Transcript_40571/m.92014 type:complete len:82 (+) Transcript_40571:177-422(+)